ncbi:MAG: hypothetical protein M3Y91_07555 [Actinomycetota bacterium]|nr:hypothetical protein [Actinomycetota bacterium]
MTQPNRQAALESSDAVPPPMVGGAHDRPSAEVVAALADAVPALGSPPLMTQAVILPVLVTGATVADLTSALASSSLQVSRTLVAKGLGAIGWG